MKVGAIIEEPMIINKPDMYTDLLGEDAYYWSADRAILDLMKYSA